jgi:DNA-nicking Smr family endonuclease
MMEAAIDNLPDDPEDPESHLWQAAVRDVKPIRRLPSSRKAGSAPARKIPAGPVIRETVMLPGLDKKAGFKAKKQGHDVDARTLDKFRRGQMPIQARMDLHGMTQDKAHKVLNKFIKSSYDQGCRCVLIVTGKGESTRTDDADWWVAPRGVLRDMVPIWLGQEPLAPMVLQTSVAQIKDGGAGALYVLLRRQRL